jgi:hypothetical protein
MMVRDDDCIIALIVGGLDFFVEEAGVVVVTRVVYRPARQDQDLFFACEET